MVTTVFAMNKYPLKVSHLTPYLLPLYELFILTDIPPQSRRRAILMIRVVSVFFGFRFSILMHWYLLHHLHRLLFLVS